MCGITDENGNFLSKEEEEEFLDYVFKKFEADNKEVELEPDCDEESKTYIAVLH